MHFVFSSHVPERECEELLAPLAQQCPQAMNVWQPRDTVELVRDHMRKPRAAALRKMWPRVRQCKRGGKQSLPPCCDAHLAAALSVAFVRGGFVVAISPHDIAAAMPVLQELAKTDFSRPVKALLRAPDGSYKLAFVYAPDAWNSDTLKDTFTDISEPAKSQKNEKNGFGFFGVAIAFCAVALSTAAAARRMAHTRHALDII